MNRNTYALPAIMAAILLFWLVSPPAHSQGPAPVGAHMTWWKDARFGLFIHWGPISEMGGEISWSRDPNPAGPNPHGIPAAVYDSLYKTFNPVNFDAKQVVSLAKAAGMKYIVFTTKHHDGFCEFDSKYTDYKVTSPECPYGRDIVKELADATHAAGLHWCVYYSPPDLHNPDYIVNQSAYDVYFHNQVMELLTKYGKVDGVWFDGLGRSADFWDAKTLFARIKAVDPDAIINNRCGLPGDYYTPEQTIGAYDDQNSWETCMTIGNNWSYNPHDSYKSGAECIQTLARCIGGDGNFLLDIGPRPDGTINPTQADRLRQIAKWMKINSEAVYGTRGGPFKPTDRYAATRKGDTVYVHVLDWQGGDSIELPALPRRVIDSRLIGGGSVAVTQHSDSLVITVPEQRHDPADTVVALKLDGTAMDLSPIAPAPRYAQYTNFQASNTFEGMSEYAPEKAFDGQGNTRWATDDAVKQCWISADLITPKLVGGVEIKEAYAGRVRAFEFQYKAVGSEDWVTLIEGKTLGDNYACRFAPVIASSIRLNILDSTFGPTINEIQVLPPIRSASMK
jgi:alpha-L-fucosidase